MRSSHTISFQTLPFLLSLSFFLFFISMYVCLSLSQCLSISLCHQLSPTCFTKISNCFSLIVPLFLFLLSHNVFPLLCVFVCLSRCLSLSVSLSLGLCLYGKVAYFGLSSHQISEPKRQAKRENIYLAKISERLAN